jgi:hypothetical protein
MGIIIITVIGFFAIFALMTYGATIITSKYVTRMIEERLEALEQLVNEQRAPEDWLRPSRQKLDAARRAGESRLARLGEQTHKRCIRKLEEMIRYTTEVNFADSEATRKTVASALKAQHELWESRDWRAWIDILDVPEAPPETTDGGLSAK